jgi:type VI secretion system secreted protein VgrG
MTIDQTVFLIATALLLSTIIVIYFGRKGLLDARDLPYFMLRRARVTQSWRVILLGLILGIASLLTYTMGRRAAYVIYPPTPSVTPTQTVTPTPTQTLVPSITPTASITPIPSSTATATVTPTPRLPEEIRILIRETVTPNPEALFSPIEVADRLNGFNQAINPQDDFFSPQGRLFGAFSYNNLQDGIRWTAIWYFRDEILCLETQPWDGGTGGYGYTECDPESWQPGRYDIQLFYGDEWKGSTYFELIPDQSGEN